MQQRTRDAVRRHYDQLSPLYRRLWGHNIHHGFWEAGESPQAAQCKLTERLAARAKLTGGVHVLDVGCGVGGPAIWLAEQLNCSVMAITISPVQAKMAAATVARLSLADRVRFEVMDAEQLTFPDASFDVVWCIECSEHLEEKQRFINGCARVLKPGGKLVVCAWLANGSAPDQRQLVAEISRAMLCPSLGTIADYVQWITEAGFGDVGAEDITPNVARTWAHCARLLGNPAVQWLLQVGNDEWRQFAAAFPAMERAYANGALGYGMFVATNKR